MSQLPETLLKKPMFFVSQQITNLYIQVGMIIGLFLILFFSHHAHAENSSRIVKWKDDKGMTHYGDKIPPPYANRENSLMNRQGITVQHNKPLNYQDKAADLAKLEQDKKDKALLGAFTNANEIDLARDRNLQFDLITLENLQQDKANGQKKLNEINDIANSYSKIKKPVPEDLNADMRKNKAEIAKIDQLISERQLAIENTRKRFDEDKKRYLSLKNHGNSASPDTPSTLNTSVKPVNTSTGSTNQ